MPIYEKEKYNEVITRIRSKIFQRDIVMGECLTENEILEFEKACNIRLPEAYRIFLQEIGDGCKMLDGFYLNSLKDIEKKDLSQPFMLQEAFIWEDENVTENQIRELTGNGHIELIDIGDCITYELLVSGKMQGEVWNFTDVGVQPCCERQDFLGWFELWLDEQNEVDYFKDYVYE